MERKLPRLALTLISFAFFLTACGNGGHVDFTPEFLAKLNKPAGYNMVPASRALATSSNGYSAKVQLNPVSGIRSSAGNGYSAQMKFTVRNR